MVKEDPRKETILEAAKSLFYAHGFSAVTMNDIARHIRMSKKTLYQFYPGKQELLLSVMENFQEVVTGRVEEILADEDLAYTEKLKTFLTYIGNAMTNMSSTLLEDIREHLPDMWRMVKDYKRKAAFDRFERLITEGMKKGYIRQDVHLPVVIALYSTAIDHLLDPAYQSQLPANIRNGFPKSTGAIFEQIIKVIFSGILSNSANQEISGAQ